MATPNEYIVFEPDQVLTNDHLNETFNYLDQQNRFTRNKLIGIGIVCGLQIVQQPGVIEITKGCGVTSQGYLLTQDTTEYPYYMPYTAIDAPNKLPFDFDKDHLPFYKPFWADKTMWLLLTDEQFNALEDAQKLSAKTLSSAGANFLSDYVVALFWEAKESDLKNCDTQDCNNKGEKMTFQIRPLLVAKNDLYSTNTNTIIAGDNPKLSLVDMMQLKRFNVPYTELKSTDNIINAFVNLVDDVTLNQVAEAYNSCYQDYGSALKVRTNPFTDLKEGLGKYRDIIVKENPLFIEYFYDFIDDLIKAYNEFNHKVSDIISTCCPNENLFPLHLILGDASQATNAYAKDIYRNYFIYSPLFSKMGTEAAELKLLFGRMVLMVKNFTIQSIELMRKTTIMITPSKYEYSWLSDRAIPYYYNVAENGAELYKSWNYYKTSKGLASLNLGYNASSYSGNPLITQPLLYDIEQYNFFRVEGHIGQDYKKVLSNILNQRLTYNLPFDVVAIAADRLSYLDVNLPDVEIRDLETDYDLIVSEATCKIHTTFCFVSKLSYTPPRIIRTNFPGGFSAQPEAKSEGKSLSFAEFKVNAIREGEPLAAIKDDGYKKGDFMRTYCPVLENTLGSYYLNGLTDTGMFNNPIGNYTPGSLNELYACLFEFIDSVEEMMAILNTNNLSSFDIYDLRSSAQRYLNATAQIVTILKNVLIKDPTKVNEVPTVIREGDINTLIDDFEMLFNICIEDRLQVLNDERTIRLIKYAKELSFLNYYKKHPGLEHKAGVPKGGTLVLVYKNYINRGLTRETPKVVGGAVKTPNAPALGVKERLNRMEAAPVISKNIQLSPDLDETTLNQFKKIVSDSKQVSDTEKAKLIGILGGKGIIGLEQEQGYDIDDNVVIADFYIPYLCPPIDHDDSVIEPPPPPPVRKPVISMDKTFCDNDRNPAPVTVSVPGGTFNEVKGLDAAKQTFTPATAGAGSFNIIYTVNNLSSDPFTVTVLPTPGSGFTVKADSGATNNPGSFAESRSSVVAVGSTVSGTFTPDVQNSLFTYNWQFTGVQRQTVDANGVAKVVVGIPRDGGIIEQPVEIRAALTVSNGNCHQSTNIRSFQVSSRGFVEGGDSMFRGEQPSKEKGQPDLELKKGDTPILTTKEEKKPDLEIKKGDAPILTTKEEKKPDLEIKKGDAPILTTKEEKKPDLEIKKSDTPILTIKEEKKPDLEIKKGDTTIVITKEEKKPDLEIKRTDKPDAIIKEEKAPDIGKKEILNPNLRLKATDKLNIRKKKEE